jgi:hypothetical protein
VTQLEGFHEAIGRVQFRRLVDTQPLTFPMSSRIRSSHNSGKIDSLTL